MTDAQLAIAFQQGDKDACDQVYRRYQSDVRGLIRKYVTESLRSEVDDICQHFWSQIFKYARGYDPSRPLRNWIFCAATKAVTSYHQSQQRKRSLTLTGQDYIPLDTDQRECCPLDQHAGPEDSAILKEDVNCVIAALGEIPIQFGQIIKAVYLDDQRPIDYAREHGISEGTVYTRLNRGLAHLRKILDPQAGVA
jgi:RNA polymerase sigma factor (sigma-70 family)